MKRVIELLDELKQDISFELIEQSGWELRNAYQTIIRRLEDIRAVAEGSRPASALCYCGNPSCTVEEDLKQGRAGGSQADSGGKTGRD